MGKCFTKVDGAQCNETCAVGKEGFTCDIVGHQSVPVHNVLGTNLNCFAVYTKDHHYVDKVEAFDMTTDGACAADRPEGEKKNKKWNAPDCSQLKTVTSHPYKKPADYFKCLSEMSGQVFA